ncbi:MAG: serine/threonine-protein kinase [Deltaproteobacteria bacterium]|nr:serine/threonine-protein kinase [Deltaproteobacteria bacterium]
MECPDPDVLTVFSRGRLEGEQRRIVESHLDGCEPCCLVVSELARIYTAAGPDDWASDDDGPEPFAQDSLVPHQGTSIGDSDTLAEDGSAPRKIARLDPGARLGRYHILEVIGEGGMGVVYAAYDADLDRKVALKVLHERGPTDGRAQRRLLREAQAMARLSHPNVITVHEAGAVDGQVFISMEFLDGGTLSRWLKAKEPERDRVLAMFRDVGRGLAAAHAVGLVHRDVKPDNVLIGINERPRVTDFGLARLADDDLSGVSDSVSGLTDPEGGIPPRIRRLPLDATLTRTGALVGTPAYMAPEQFRREPTTPASDQFSFCVALHEALWGSRPFTGRTLGQLAENVLAGTITEPTRDVSVPRWLRQLVWRGLSLEPEDRWPSMDALVERLRAGPRRARRRIMIAGSVGLVLVGAASLASGQLSPHEDPCDRGAEMMDELWSPTMRAQLHNALAEGATAHAEQTATLALGHIDDYAGSWKDSHRDACESYHRGAQSDEALDLRGGCLDERRRELDALLGVLTQSDPGVRRHAIEAIDGLQPVAPCEDVKALRSRVPPPQDPHVRVRVTQIDNDLVTVRAQLYAGQYERGLALSHEVTEAARVTNYPPLVARALRDRATLYRRQGQHEDALDGLREAWQLALGAGDDALAADCLVGLVGVLGYSLQRFDEAEVRIADADAMIERVRRFDEVRAEWLAGELDYERGQLLLRKHRLEEAITRYRQAQRVAERRSGTDGLRVASILNATASTLLAQGNWEEALAIYLRVVEIRVKRLGAAHPETAHAHNNVGLALKQLERYDEAATHLERAQAYLSAALGREHPSLRMVAANLAEVYFSSHRHGLAADNYAKAYEPVTPPSITHEYTLRRVWHYGVSLRRVGRVAEARRVLTLARDRAYELGELEHGRTIVIELARVDIDDGHYQAALDQLRPVLAGSMPDSILAADSALATAYAHLGLGDLDKARAQLSTIHEAEHRLGQPAVEDLRQLERLLEEG